MCILVLKEAGTVVTKERLEAMAENNKDGNGFSYVNTDHYGRKKIITYKSMDFGKFYDKLRRAERNNPESNFIIHHRIATSGVLSRYNCHPFTVNKELVFAHNGIIANARKDPDNKMNDTQMFSEDVLKYLPKDFIFNGAIQELIEDYIGFSKLVFLDVDNNYVIMNEDRGEWLDGAWYSNTSYKPRVKYTSMPKATTTGGRGQAPKINSTTMVECDYCSTYVKALDLNAYQSYGFVEGYCDKCEKMLLKDSIILKSEKATIFEFIQSCNSEIERENQQFCRTYDN